MLRFRVILASSFVVACAACSQGGAATSPSPSDTPTLSSPTAPSTPTSTLPSTLVGYSAKERTAYLAAVRAYNEFSRRNDSFYAAGRTTGAAKRFYQRYAVDWSTAWGNLAQAANNHVKVTGSTNIVWTKPQSIKLGQSMGDVVVLRRCLDESGWVVTQNGKVLDQPQLKQPHVDTIRLEKHPGEDWWRAGVAKQGPTC
ncbi:MAG: hypothetical protein QOI06_3335 [Nocardioidaceae bacterium]|jgi:hypothetical protein|nr:hypothetical protein [Nocardioidaceae bacterium]